jgi:hypothetical protein
VGKHPQLSAVHILGLLASLLRLTCMNKNSQVTKRKYAKAKKTKKKN